MLSLLPSFVSIPESMKEAYEAHLEEEKILLTRMLCILGGVLVALSVFVDAWAMPAIRTEINIVRGLILTIKLAGLWATYQAFFPRYCTLIQHMICFLPAAGISFVIYLSSPQDSGHYLYFCFILIIVMVVFSWTHGSLRSMIFNALSITGIYTLAIYLNTLSHKGFHGFLEVYVPSVYSMLGAFIIGVFYKIIKEQHVRKGFLLQQSLEYTLEQQNFIANHDALTGLTNRRYAEKNIHHDLLFAKKHKMQNILLLMDLNGFKGINDEYGHQAGDNVLKEVSKRLQSVTQLTTDHISRLGGDEFVISILSKENTTNYTELMMQEIRRVVAKPMKISADVTLNVGISIGASCYPEDGIDYSTLMRKADQRMYANKEALRAKKESDKHLKSLAKVG